MGFAPDRARAAGDGPSAVDDEKAAGHSFPRKRSLSRRPDFLPIGNVEGLAGISCHLCQGPVGSWSGRVAGVAAELGASRSYRYSDAQRHEGRRRQEPTEATA